jgi:hypothetical protein
MKIRIWTGKETLAAIHGREIGNFRALDKWLSTQPNGEIQVWAGRWWRIGIEARPFTLRAGTVFCSYLPYQSRQGLHPADYTSFFVYEAWKIARRISDMYTTLPKALADSIGETK